MSLGGFIDDFGSGLASANGGTISESFLRETNKVTIVRFPTPMPRKMWILFDKVKVEIIVGILTGVFTSEKVLDIGYAHTSMVRHSGVRDNIARFKTVKRSSGRFGRRR